MWEVWSLGMAAAVADAGQSLWVTVVTLLLPGLAWSLTLPVCSKCLLNFENVACEQPS